MKKTMLFLVVLATITISCRKNGGFSNDSGDGSAFRTGSPAIGQPQTPPVTQEILTGEWASVRFSANSVNGMNFLRATYLLSNALPPAYSDAVKIIYARMENGNGFSYLLLPIQYRTVYGDLHFRAEMTDEKIDITIHYENYFPMPGLRPFTGYQYRYLVVPRSIYQTLSVNWYDYTAVAASLNFSL